MFQWQPHGGVEPDDAAVHHVSQLSAGQTIAGPAIIEQPDGAAVLPPGSLARVDQFDNVLVSATS